MVKPKLVIGMPVYNGATHLAETLESILGQSFSDFHLLISDNGSTDASGDICREFASKDDRVAYHLQPENLGVSGNFNYVFKPGEAPYFKWAAHDDPLDQNYLAACMERMESDPALAIAHCPSVQIDGDGELIGIYDDLGLSGGRVSERFWRILWTVNIYEFYGVMRTEMVRKAMPIDVFFGAERNVLGDILLQGDIAYIDEPLFLRRDHEEAVTAMHLDAKSEGDFDRMQKEFAPKVDIGSVGTSVVKTKAYAGSILRFPMPIQERIACFSALSDWFVRSTLQRTLGVGRDHHWELQRTRRIAHPNCDRYVAEAMKEKPALAESA
ncbi:MAG: glycosyltransferase [Myxococcota bacterium]